MSRSSLTFYLKDIGVDSVFSNEPNDYTQKNIVSKEIKKEQKQTFPEQKNKSFILNIEECKTLSDLKNLVLNFNDCDLKKTALNTVFCDGIESAPVMVIGEAPGADEDKLGKPFVGQSGQLVDKMFKTIGLKRDKNMYITNVVFWRPPGNRQPTPAEIDMCYPFLQKHIEFIKPKVIILLGGVSTKTILKTDLGIVKLRGKKNEYIHENLSAPIPVLPFYHPAYLLRSPRQKATFWHDLITLKQLLKNLNIVI
jgi:uracil-DNA glycosylase family 4